MHCGSLSSASFGWVEFSNDLGNQIGDEIIVEAEPQNPAMGGIHGLNEHRIVDDPQLAMLRAFLDVRHKFTDIQHREPRCSTDGHLA